MSVDLVPSLLSIREQLILELRLLLLLLHTHQKKKNQGFEQCRVLEGVNIFSVQLPIDILPRGSTCSAFCLSRGILDRCQESELSTVHLKSLEQSAFDFGTSVCT